MFLRSLLLRITSDIYTIHIVVAYLLAYLSSLDTYYIYLGTKIVDDKSVGLLFK